MPALRPENRASRLCATDQHHITSVGASNSMDLRKLKTLIDLVSESNVSELEITEAEGKVRIVKSPPVTAVPMAAPMVAPMVTAAPVLAAVSATAPTAAAEAAA